MRTLNLVDLFCGAGGAAMGLHQGLDDLGIPHEIYGVDNRTQKRYPFHFVLGDALCPPFDLREFDFIWASPPCQKYSNMTRGRWKDRAHPDLIAPIRQMLKESGKPYLIENVSGAARELQTPFMLCGTMLGLESKTGNQLLRHRYFESPYLFSLTPPCAHNHLSAVGVYGGGQNPARRKRRPDLSAEFVDFGIVERRRAMGIDWMTGKELNEAIPPAYSRYIIKQIFGNQ